VRLKAIAPPEAGQPFSEAARDHLKALTFDKAVFVEYTNLASGYLEAKVFVNGIDIGSQMLRDGVAWYDRSFDYSLSAGDRDLYMRCEQAARDEKRGLWSDSSPMAPWEFRRAKQAGIAQVNPPASFPAIWTARTSRASERRMLSSRYLGAGSVEPGAIAGNPIVKQVSPESAPGEWTTFQSEVPRFSIQVPGNSYLYEYPVLDSDLKIISINYIVGSSDATVYTLMWTRGANDGVTDVIAAGLTIKGLVRGLNIYFETKGDGLSASFRPGCNVRFGSYAGKQYAVTAGSLSGFARVVSRQIGDQRELFALAVFAAPGDDSGFEFLNSLKISETGR
jgi:hypothetical protein